jgi:hypothetical protein
MNTEVTFSVSEPSTSEAFFASTHTGSARKAFHEA